MWAPAERLEFGANVIALTHETIVGLPVQADHHRVGGIRIARPVKTATASDHVSARSAGDEVIGASAIEPVWPIAATTFAELDSWIVPS